MFVLNNSLLKCRVCYFLLRRRKANEEKSAVELEQNGANGANGTNGANVPDSEITSL